MTPLGRIMLLQLLVLVAMLGALVFDSLPLVLVLLAAMIALGWALWLSVAGEPERVSRLDDPER